MTSEEAIRAEVIEKIAVYLESVAGDYAGDISDHPNYSDGFVEEMLYGIATGLRRCGGDLKKIDATKMSAGQMELAERARDRKRTRAGRAGAKWSVCHRLINCIRKRRRNRQWTMEEYAEAVGTSPSKVADVLDGIDMSGSTADVMEALEKREAEILAQCRALEK